jgi:hypothetical protein
MIMRLELMSRPRDDFSFSPMLITE